MNDISSNSCLMVIFGGTGDLTHRKLMPAIYNLICKGNLEEGFAVVSVGRRKYSHHEYRNIIKESIEKYSKLTFKKEMWEIFQEKIYYISLEFSEDEGYEALNNFLGNLETKYNICGKRTYYLAVAPEFFEIITDKLRIHDMVNGKLGQNRIVIEKPFGRDLESARYLNNKITKVFSENNIYRIDHYLGKEMIQNIMVLRFANPVFEAVWNNKYIDNIQISAGENVGVENRGGYYETSGAFKDMIQNHMFQLLTLIAMEPPAKLETESIRNEKVKVINSLEPLTEEYIKDNVIKGQYGSGIVNGEFVKAYREEDKVSLDSNVETFAALKLFIQNYRWAGVPFYIRTGKRLKSKSTHIVIQFKSIPKILYFKENDALISNLLVIRIQPDEHIYFQFNTKTPGTENKIVPVQMDFCHSCEFNGNSPEAYERLLSDVIKGDATLFTRWDEVESSWSFVDSILKEWKREEKGINFYPSGTMGPDEADRLLSRENRNWWNI